MEQKFEQFMGGRSRAIKPILAEFMPDAERSSAEKIHCQGVAHCPKLLTMSEESILENFLQDDQLARKENRPEDVQHVVGVKRIVSNRNGVLNVTTFLALTFDTSTLPAHVYFNGKKLKVNSSDPLRCKKCQRFGHSAITCSCLPNCATCARASHLGECTSPVSCINCKGSHPAWSRKCPTFQDETEIAKIKVSMNLSWPDARKVYAYRSNLPSGILVSCQGVVHCPELLTVSEESILDRLCKDDQLALQEKRPSDAQNIAGVQRIVAKRKGANTPTEGLILTFSKASLPKHVTIWSHKLSVHPHEPRVPNPPRCLKCQQFGHSSVSCTSLEHCGQCAQVSHSGKCTSPTLCINCTGLHPAWSLLCPRLLEEKEVLKIMVTRRLSSSDAWRIYNDLGKTPHPKRTNSTPAQKKATKKKSNTKQAGPPGKSGAKQRQPQPDDLPDDLSDLYQMYASLESLDIDNYERHEIDFLEKNGPRRRKGGRKNSAY